ncbi:MAG: hypothetical protein HA496_06490 [Thaumarchaeota archaeon]|nr:hypothetical protein [Nitrososphaerota archaeon]
MSKVKPTPDWLKNLFKPVEQALPAWWKQGCTPSPIVKQDPGELFRNIIPDQSIPETRFGEKNHYEPF